MSYDRELHNLIPVLNRLSNSARGATVRDRGDFNNHYEPDSSQFLQRLENLEHQLKHFEPAPVRQQQQQPIPVNLTRNNYEQQQLNRTAPHDQRRSKLNNHRNQVLHNNFESENEIRQLQQRLDTLQRKRDEQFNAGRRIERNNLEHASIIADCGTPNRHANGGKYELGDYETTEDDDDDHETAITSITRTITPSQQRETDRLSRVERLLIQLISRQDAQDEKIKTLSTIKPPQPKVVSSTPYRAKKNKTSVEDEMRQLVNSQKNNKSFLMAILPLLSIANTDQLRDNIVEKVKDVVEQRSEDEYTKSEYSCSETEDEHKIGTFLTMNLTELVKLTLQPIMTEYMSSSRQPSLPLTKAELDEIVTKIVENCGASRINGDIKTRFIHSIRDPMQRFVGAGTGNKDKMFVELSDVLFNEIRFVRTLYEGGPLKTRLLELEADEDAPRHVSINNDDKNIPLSVAEAQALTCYGSGEDEESIKSTEDTLPRPEMKTELKAQSEGTGGGADSSSSSPCFVEKEY